MLKVIIFDWATVNINPHLKATMTSLFLEGTRREKL